jgi:two-component system NtrC family sensor kinase
MPPTRWFARLSVQVTAVITTATALGGGLSLWLVLQAQQRLLTDQTMRQAAFLNDTLLHSLERHMLRNERGELDAALSAVARQPGMIGLRLFDAAGRTAYSNRRHEIGRVADLREPTCQACHTGPRSPGPLDVNARSRVVETSGQRVLATLTPVYNAAACTASGCHRPPGEQRVLGVLEAETSLAEVDGALGALQRSTATISLLTIAGLALVAIVFTRRTLVEPIAELATVVGRFKAGELHERVETRGSGEIADLAYAVNDMAGTLYEARQQRLALLQSLERQVEERTAALERARTTLAQHEKLSSLGRLSASIAHEINNPLAGILTYSKLLLRTLDQTGEKSDLHERQVQQVRLIERETRRCAHIVRGLLDFARDRPLSLDAVDVNAVVDEALSLVRNQAGLQNVALVTELAPLPPVEADLGQIRQALLNVIINACEAMTKGGSLRIATRAVADGIEVSISDTGIGISKEDLDRVLDPFFTTKEMGTGLGLSVVYGIVQRHGGSLHIDSTAGVGTTVTLRLPSREDGCSSPSPGSAKVASPTA